MPYPVTMRNFYTRQELLVEIVVELASASATSDVYHNTAPDITGLEEERQLGKINEGELDISYIFDFARRNKLNFKDSSLLIRALTHRSYLNEHPEALEDNERLEFLGDAILDFLVGAWLYNQFPEKAEGELTRLRSALVRTEQLASFANIFDIGSVIRLGKGEIENGGRTRNIILCSTFEALIGALYLDEGLDEVQKFIEPLLEPAVSAIISSRGYKDPKSVLQEWVQGRGLPPPEYRTISSAGPEHDKLFEVEVIISDKVICHGSGRSKQAAAKDAAINAIKKLGVD